jgi:AbiV family abortive infection protein
MKVREAKALGTLPDPKFFAVVSEGIGHVVTNATRLEESARAVREARRPQATRILSLLAEEEAAKGLILLDAVRCPRKEQQIRSRQLGYFNDHLARGIYADLAGARPSDFAELERYAASMRKTHYLDGPNDVDWIFRNQILAEREDAIYVDYMESDGEYSWHAPRDDEMLLMAYMAPPSLRIAQALHAIGLTSPKGLEIVAGIWRKVRVHSALTWHEVRELNLATFSRLQAEGITGGGDRESASTLVNRWQFPLYPLDLRPDQVDQKDLEEMRERWQPDW